MAIASAPAAEMAARVASVVPDRGWRYPGESPASGRRQVRHPDVGAELGQRDGGGGADAVVGTGDEGDTAGQRPVSRWLQL
jgi:hypothetical protein